METTTASIAANRLSTRKEEMPRLRAKDALMLMTRSWLKMHAHAATTNRNTRASAARSCGTMLSRSPIR